LKIKGLKGFHVTFKLIKRWVVIDQISFWNSLFEHLGVIKLGKYNIPNIKFSYNPSLHKN